MTIDEIKALAEWLDTPLGSEADRVMCKKAAATLRQLADERDRLEPNVFILSCGEYGEGSTIDGVFLTFEDATAAAGKKKLLSCDFVKVEEWHPSLGGGTGDEVFYKRGPQE